MFAIMKEIPHTYCISFFMIADRKSVPSILTGIAVSKKNY